MNTDRFFTLWFHSQPPLCSVFKISSTCDPRHVGALFPLALNICSKHMFHATYAPLKLLLASVLCQCTILAVEIWISSIQRPCENLNEPWIRIISKKNEEFHALWGKITSREVVRVQYVHVCLFIYMSTCVCVCGRHAVCVLEGRIITHCLRALSRPSSSAKGLTQIWLKDNMWPA